MLDNYSYKKLFRNKANVPADLHELLSAAKNLPELSIRICDPKLIQFIYNKMEAKLWIKILTEKSGQKILGK